MVVDNMLDSHKMNWAVCVLYLHILSTIAITATDETTLTLNKQVNNLISSLKKIYTYVVVIVIVRDCDKVRGMRKIRQPVEEILVD